MKSTFLIFIVFVNLTAQSYKVGTTLNFGPESSNISNSLGGSLFFDFPLNQRISLRSDLSLLFSKLNLESSNYKISIVSFEEFMLYNKNWNGTKIIAGFGLGYFRSYINESMVLNKNHNTISKIYDAFGMSLQIGFETSPSDNFSFYFLIKKTFIPAETDIKYIDKYNIISEFRSGVELGQFILSLGGRINL